MTELLSFVVMVADDCAVGFVEVFVEVLVEGISTGKRRRPSGSEWAMRVWMNTKDRMGYGQMVYGVECMVCWVT